MTPANFGAVRRLLHGAAVLALLASPASSQVVEKGRTFADLTATHPCSSAYTDRIARVTDCDAADDIGDGEGAYQCWATCDGSAPWATVAIGGGGGLPGADEVTESMLKAVDAAADEECLTYESTVGDFEWQSCGPVGDVVGPASSTDNAIARFDSTTGKLLQNSAVTVADTTGAISGAQSITGGASGTSTLTLDGDSGVAGTVTIGSAGSITVPTGSTGGVLVGTTLIREDSSKLYVTDNAISAYRGIYALSFHASGDISAGSSVSVGSSGAIHIGGDTGLIRESAGVMTLTNNSTGKRAFFGGGAAVASATALPVPAARMFHVTGTTTITSITSTNLQDGVCVTLIFDDVLTFTDGGNLRLNGDFVTSADDTLSLCYDGTNWFETSRSFN